MASSNLEELSHVDLQPLGDPLGALRCAGGGCAAHLITRIRFNHLPCNKLLGCTRCQLAPPSAASRSPAPPHTAGK